MKKKVSIMIFIISILIIVGYIYSSELLSMKKKNVHSTIVPENKAISFIARGPIVSLLYNEDKTVIAPYLGHDKLIVVIICGGNMVNLTLVNDWIETFLAG